MGGWLAGKGVWPGPDVSLKCHPSGPRCGDSCGFPRESGSINRSSAVGKLFSLAPRRRPLRFSAAGRGTDYNSAQTDFL